MKLRNILALALFATAFTACETVDEDERFIGPVEFTPKKNVLIEDFTGQKCINCPNATNVIHSLQHTYGKDHIIAVALHGGPMSMPATTPVGLATPESEEYNTKWNVDSWPKGMINRKGGLFEFTSWSAEVVKELQEEASAVLSMESNTYNPEDGTLTVQVDVTGKQATKATLQVWLTESDIVKMQFMPDGKPNRDYVHNHVFRTSVNGTWGEELDLVKEEKVSKQYTYKIEPSNKWKPENMSVVAFVSNADGVMQVIEAPVIQK